MTTGEFRAMALGLPEAEEREHMDHPDFRVGGKIFATLGYPGPGWAAVSLTPAQQQLYALAHPKAFIPVKGGWGARGATNVRLSAAGKRTVKQALTDAWRNRAPKRLVRAAGRDEEG
jgi:hypothetical protein